VINRTSYQFKTAIAERLTVWFVTRPDIQEWLDAELVKLGTDFFFECDSISAFGIGKLLTGIRVWGTHQHMPLDPNATFFTKRMHEEIMREGSFQRFCVHEVADVIPLIQKCQTNIGNAVHQTQFWKDNVVKIRRIVGNNKKVREVMTA
jgi:hypothetical protein